MLAADCFPQGQHILTQNLLAAPVSLFLPHLPHQQLSTFLILHKRFSILTSQIIISLLYSIARSKAILLHAIAQCLVVLLDVPKFLAVLLDVPKCLALVLNVTIQLLCIVVKVGIARRLGLMFNRGLVLLYCELVLFDIGLVLVIRGLVLLY